MVARVGFESSQAVEITSNNDESRTAGSSRDDLTPRTEVASGPTDLQSTRTGEGGSGPVEGALAEALTAASAAGRWDVVAQLARELEARRLVSSNVVPLRTDTGRRSP
jgi:hypothetical protein